MTLDGQRVLLHCHHVDVPSRCIVILCFGLEKFGSGKGKKFTSTLASLFDDILDLVMICTGGLGTWCRREAAAWWIIRLLPCETNSVWVMCGVGILFGQALSKLQFGSSRINFAIVCKVFLVGGLGFFLLEGLAAIIVAT